MKKITVVLLSFFLISPLFASGYNESALQKSDTGVIKEPTSKTGPIYRHTTPGSTKGYMR